MHFYFEYIYFMLHFTNRLDLSHLPKEKPIDFLGLSGIAPTCRCRWQKPLLVPSHLSCKTRIFHVRPCPVKLMWFPPKKAVNISHWLHLYLTYCIKVWRDFIYASNINKAIQKLFVSQLIWYLCSCITVVCFLVSSECFFVLLSHNYFIRTHEAAASAQHIQPRCC